MPTISDNGPGIRGNDGMHTQLHFGSVQTGAEISPPAFPAAARPEKKSKDARRTEKNIWCCDNVGKSGTR